MVPANPTFNATFATTAANGSTSDTGNTLSTAGTVSYASAFANDCLLDGMYAKSR